MKNLNSPIQKNECMQPKKTDSSKDVKNSATFYRAQFAFETIKKIVTEIYLLFADWKSAITQVFRKSFGNKSWV